MGGGGAGLSTPGLERFSLPVCVLGPQQGTATDKAAQREEDLSAPAGNAELITKLTLITGFEGA